MCETKPETKPDWRNMRAEIYARLHCLTAWATVLIQNLMR